LDPLPPVPRSRRGKAGIRANAAAPSTYRVAGVHRRGTMPRANVDQPQCAAISVAHLWRRVNARPCAMNTLYDNCDVCLGNAQEIGWLDVFANAKGRKALADAFPGLSIKWTAASKLPPSVGPGWCGAYLNLPRMCQDCPKHELAQVVADPDDLLNIYGQRLAVTLYNAGCRVITHDKVTGYKRLHSEARL
jgi:hypothetical protein